MCRSDSTFTKWLITHYAQVIWPNDSPWDEWPRTAEGTFAITPLERPIPPPSSKKNEGYWHELQRLMPIAPTLIDSVYDESSYGIIRCANVLYDSFRIFEQLPRFQCDEVALRQPFEQLMRHVFGVDGKLHFVPECHIPLLPLPPGLPQESKLPYSRTVRGNAGVITFATLDTSKLHKHDEIQLELNTQLHLLPPSTDPKYAYGVRRLAVPELVVQTKTRDFDTSLRHIQLDLVAMLLHRRRIGLDDRPLYGIAINARDIYYATASWDGESPTVNIHRPKQEVSKFEHWVEFYLFLMKIRLSIEASEVPTIKVHHGTRESDSKRKRDDSQDDEPSPDTDAPPRKRARMAAGCFTIQTGTRSGITETQVHTTDETPTDVVESVTPGDSIQYTNSPAPMAFTDPELLDLGFSEVDGAPLEEVYMDAAECRELEVYFSDL